MSEEKQSINKDDHIISLDLGDGFTVEDGTPKHWRVDQGNIRESKVYRDTKRGILWVDGTAFDMRAAWTPKQIRLDESEASDE